MQTFLPYPDFDKSARCLDNKRLNKQVVECGQILKALIENKGWIHHPATKMWKGHEYSLCQYMQACYKEMLFRGLARQHKSVQYVISILREVQANGDDPPWWLGKSIFHERHKLQLFMKDNRHYYRFDPGICGILEHWDAAFILQETCYLWPDMDTKTFKMSKSDEAKLGKLRRNQL